MTQLNSKLLRHASSSASNRPWPVGLRELAALALAVSLCACGSFLPNAGGSGDNSAPPTDDGSSPPAGDGWPEFKAAPSGRANQATVVAGEFVGTDEIHFARGANADGLFHEQYYAADGNPPDPQPTPVEDDDVYRHATWGAFGADRAAHNGDYLLPTDTDVWPDFTADLGFMRMRVEGDDLFLKLRFVSFPAPTAQIATVTFTAVGGAPQLTDWPRNAGIASTYDSALTIHGEGAALNTAAGADTDLAALGGATRVTDHAFEVRVPLGALPPGPWLVGVGAGLADPADPTRYWTVPAGSPTATTPGTDASTAPGSNVWDLMFTPHDPLWHDDHAQSALLSSGDVSTAVVEVDPNALKAGADIPAPVITGRITHTYESEYDFGDGIVRGPMSTPPIPASPAPANVRPRDPAISYEYTGALQPYFAYIPEAYPNSTHDWPLILYLHGLNNYIWEPFGLTLGLEDMLEERGYLFASLLGRGDIFFSGRGELDPLEVIAHMSERYRVDPNRIYLVGHSHGAGGTIRVARRNPDLFAAAVAAQIQEDLLQPENFRHLPTIHIAGAGDPIDNGASAQSRYDAISALGFDTQLLIYPSKTHENSSIYDNLTSIFNLYDASVREPNPAVVSFTREGGDFDESLGLLHDRAYWVQGMIAVDPAQNMSILAESFGIPHTTLEPDAATRVDSQLVDTGGPSGRSLGLLSTTTAAYGDAAPVGDSATLSATNLSAVTLDTHRMGIDVRAPDAVMAIVTDARLSLALTGVSGESLDWTAADADGATVSGTAVRAGNRFVIELPEGENTLRFVR